MFKLIIAATIIAIYVAFPTSAEAQAELVAAGVSTSAAEGIVAIGAKYSDQLEAAKTSSDKDSGKAVFEEMQAEVDTYIKTQSTSDQTAYAAFIAKKKAEHQGHHTTASK